MKIAKSNQIKTGWLGKDNQLKIALHLDEIELPTDIDPDESLIKCVKYVGKEMKHLPASVRPVFAANLIASIFKNQAA